MKKKIKVLLVMMLIMACTLVFAGCGDKQVTIKYPGADKVKVTTVGYNLVDATADGNTITVTYNKTGTFRVLFQVDGKDKEYEMKVTYHEDTGISVSDNSGMTKIVVSEE